jgi:hypothetical protein
LFGEILIVFVNLANNMHGEQQEETGQGKPKLIDIRTKDRTRLAKINRSLTIE